MFPGFRGRAGVRGNGPHVAPNAKLLAETSNLVSPPAKPEGCLTDSTRRTEGSEGTTVPIAVPVPEGVKYNTTVPER